MAQHETSTRRQSTVSKQTHTVPAGTGPKPDADEPRRVRLGKYSSFQLQAKKLAPAYEDRGVPGGFRLLRRSIGQIWTHRKLLGGVTIIFGFVNFMLAGGFLDSSSFEEARNNITDALGGSTGSQATAGTTLLALLITSGGGNGITDATSAYQFVLIMLGSLALTWTLRQIHAGKAATLRGAWYAGTAGLVQFFLVICILFLELLPFVGGAFLVNQLVLGGITEGYLEAGLVFLIFGLLTLLSIYWLCGTIFALQIVTLAGMTPVRAVRSSNELVRYRRGVVLRRLLVGAFAIVLVAILLIGPVALTFPSAAPATFFVFATLTLTVVHTYLYNLYRELVG